MPGLGTIIGLVGGWRATGFAIGMIAMGAVLAWQNAVTIPGLRGDLADARVALADERVAHAQTVAELSKAVTAANHNAAELKRVTEDAVTAKARADKARKDAEARARDVAAQLDAIKKEMANAEDGPVAPALRVVLDSLRGAP